MAGAQVGGPGPTLRPEALYGQWEGRIEALPGQYPSGLPPAERAALERGKRLLGSVAVFVRLGPAGACKLSTKVVGGPMKSEVARWSLVGSVVKIDRAPAVAPGALGAPGPISAGPISAGPVAPGRRGVGTQGVPAGVPGPRPVLGRGAARPSLVGIFDPKTGQLRFDLPRGEGRLKGRLLMVRTGLPAAPGIVAGGVGARA